MQQAAALRPSKKSACFESKEKQSHPTICMQATLHMYAR
jgi:hypothetical protein